MFLIFYDEISHYICERFIGNLLENSFCLFFDPLDPDPNGAWLGPRQWRGNYWSATELKHSRVLLGPLWIISQISSTGTELLGPLRFLPTFGLKNVVVPNIKNKHIWQYLPSLIWLCMTAKNLRPAKKALNYTVHNTGSLQHGLCNLRSDSYDFPMK